MADDDKPSEIIEGFDPFMFADEVEIIEPIATFRGFISQWHGTRYGEVAVMVTVPLQYKYDAMPITDAQGLMLEFRVYKPPRKGVHVNGEGEDDDET